MAAEQIRQLRSLHDQIPTRAGHWCHNLEGSYAPVAELASIQHLGRRWLFSDRGHRNLDWDDHCNRAHTRWVLREHGVTLTGPTPASFMAELPADLLRREAAASLPTLLDDLATWIDIDAVAWGQRYAVATPCRMLYTFESAEVARKAGALEWALRTLEPRWRPLLGQVRDERSRGGIRTTGHVYTKPTPRVPLRRPWSPGSSWRMPRSDNVAVREDVRLPWSVRCGGVFRR